MLGKHTLYQLSYTRINSFFIPAWSFCQFLDNRAAGPFWRQIWKKRT